MKKQTFHFTLVELLSVIAILMTLLSVATVSLSDRFFTPDLDSIGRELQLLVTQCHRSACARNEEIPLDFNPQKRCFSGNGRSVVLPEEFTCKIDGQELTQTEIVAMFHPNGGASDVTIRLETKETYGIWRISPLFGNLYQSGE